MFRSKVMAVFQILLLRNVQTQKTFITLDLDIGLSYFLCLNNFSDNFRSSLTPTFYR